MQFTFSVAFGFVSLFVCSWFFLQTSEKPQNTLIKNIGETNISDSQKVGSELKMDGDNLYSLSLVWSWIYMVAS